MFDEPRDVWINCEQANYEFELTCEHFANHPPAILRLENVFEGCLDILSRLRVDAVYINQNLIDDDDPYDRIADAVTRIARKEVHCYTQFLSLSIAQRLPASISTLELASDVGVHAALDHRLGARQLLNFKASSLISDEEGGGDASALARMMARGAIERFQSFGRADEWAQVLASAPALVHLKMKDIDLDTMVCVSGVVLPSLETLVVSVQKIAHAWFDAGFDAGIDALSEWVRSGSVPRLRELTINTRGRLQHKAAHLRAWADATQKASPGLTVTVNFKNK